MAATPLGTCRCPLCGGSARMSLSKNKLSCMTCNACMCQLFARGDKADELLRDLIDKAPAAEPQAQPEPTRYEEHRAIAQASAAAAALSPPPAARHHGGAGLLGHWFAP